MHHELTSKQVDSDESGSDKEHSEDEVIHFFPVMESLFTSSQSAGPQLSIMETALAKIQNHIVKKYQHDDDDGITYRYNDGSTLRLTPFLIKEWARAIVSTDILGISLSLTISPLCSTICKLC